MSCTDGEPEYVTQDQLPIKAISITPAVAPYILPDGNLITLVSDSQNDELPSMDGAISKQENKHETNTNTTTYHLVKIDKDGSTTESPDITYQHSGNNEGSTPFNFNNNSNSGTHTFHITSNGNAYCKYTSGNSSIALSTLQDGSILDVSIDNLIGAVALDDGTCAIIHGNTPTMSIYGNNGEKQKDIQLSGISSDEKSSYNAYGICGNIMIINATANDSKYDFYVYSPAGELLNSGSLNYLFDQLVNIIDPDTQTSTHCYAITSSTTAVIDGEQQTCNVITRLDASGNTTYEQIRAEEYVIVNAAEYDGQLMLASYYISSSYDSYSRGNSRMMASTSMEGYIVTLDASTGDEIQTYTIALDGGVMPYGAVPDGNGGYYVYMARFFSSDGTMMGGNSTYGSTIYIYRIDDLTKLNIE